MSNFDAARSYIPDEEIQAIADERIEVDCATPLDHLIAQQKMMDYYFESGHMTRDAKRRYHATKTKIQNMINVQPSRRANSQMRLNLNELF